MLYIYNPSSDWHKRFDLTEGKQYHCQWNGEMFYSSDGTYYKLINDLGREIEVHENHFTPLDKWREQKINKIGI